MHAKCEVYMYLIRFKTYSDGQSWQTNSETDRQVDRQTGQKYVPIIRTRGIQIGI